jgi:hypothetical protein
MGSQAHAFGEISGGLMLGAVATVRSVRTALVAAGAILSPALILYAKALRRIGE